MVAAMFQILIGFTGLVGFLLRFVGPLTIAPTITLVGLALFQASADFSGMKTILTSVLTSLLSSNTVSTRLNAATFIILLAFLMRGL